MTDSTLIFTTFLTSTWYKFSLYMTEYVERCAGVPAILLHDGMLDDFISGATDASFIDVLSYFQLLEQQPCPVELLAVPVAQDGSEHDIYSSFFDIVVRKESPLHVSDDLEGCVWAHHGGTSHVEDDFLYQQGVPALNFSKTIETSSPAQALRYVLDGQADAASIDARTFDMVLHNSPCMADRLRILGSGCRADLPLVVVAAQLDTSLKQSIREAFLAVHQEPLFSRWLQEKAIERFIPANNSYYQDAHMWHKRSQQKSISLPLREQAIEIPVPALAQRYTSSL